jgi:tRNA nucleotidyltransferase/poly(A) polymerase
MWQERVKASGKGGGEVFKKPKTKTKNTKNHNNKTNTDPPTTNRSPNGDPDRYADGSRIPSMALGTPAEDASRRDLTINAMFYNVNTDTIEDFCGTSLSDLQLGVVRTPCPPLQTFLDDPLRVLRAVRFAGRFQFRLCPELCAAASCAEVTGIFHCKNPHSYTYAPQNVATR